jgi:hypothetical protein
LDHDRFQFRHTASRSKSGCTPIDFISTAKYSKLCADQGNEIGQFNYAACLFKGGSVPIDSVLAA